MKIKAVSDLITRLSKKGRCPQCGRIFDKRPHQRRAVSFCSRRCVGLYFEPPEAKTEKIRAILRANPKANMAEIGREFHISRERVRQIAKPLLDSLTQVGGGC